MQDIFKVTVKIKGTEPIYLLFDNQNRAERFINAITQILNKKGKKEVEFIPEIVSLITTDEEIVEAFKTIF